MWQIIEGSGRKKEEKKSHNSLKQDIGCTCSERGETKVFKGVTPENDIKIS